MSQPVPSKSAVRRAGSTIRRYARGEATEEEYDHAVETMLVFRALFLDPLGEVQNILRRILTASKLDVELTQRLKKSITIHDKLTREAKLDLSRMQDIGGCRAVAADLNQLRELRRLIESAWGGDVAHTKDYISEPRESGYRAVHVVVRQDGRLIEIQLRTVAMHEWAETVEAFSQLTSSNFKQDGGHEVQEMMKLVSAVDQLRERGSPVPKDLVDRLSKLVDEVKTFLASATD